MRSGKGTPKAQRPLHKTTPLGARPYEEVLIERLRGDSAEACAYLQASFADGNIQVFLMALRIVAQAHGGIGHLATRAGLSREALYRTLSSKGNPSLTTLTAVLHALGFELAILPSSTSHELRTRKTPHEPHKTRKKHKVA
jgi:probable addiction module antidote protein